MKKSITYLSPDPRTKFVFTPEYRAWAGMKTACYNKNYRTYPTVGGRGIKVCARWAKFAEFIADVGPRPTKHHRLKRLDRDGHYEPGNVAWRMRK